MNQDRFHGIRLQLIGVLKEQWGRFTGDSLMVVSGTSDRYAGMVTEQRGIAAQEADRQLKDFMHRNRNWLDLSQR